MATPSKLIRYATKDYNSGQLPFRVIRCNHSVDGKFVAANRSGPQKQFVSEELIYQALFRNISHPHFDHDFEAYVFPTHCSFSLQSICIDGPVGVGKTSLMRRVFETRSTNRFARMSEDGEEIETSLEMDSRPDSYFIARMFWPKQGDDDYDVEDNSTHGWHMVITTEDFNKYLEHHETIPPNVFYIHCMAFYRDLYMQLYKFICKLAGTSNGTRFDYCGKMYPVKKLTLVLDRSFYDSCYFYNEFCTPRDDYSSMVSSFLVKLMPFVRFLQPTRWISVIADPNEGLNTALILKGINERGRYFERGFYKADTVARYYRFFCYLVSYLNKTGYVLQRDQDVQLMLMIFSPDKIFSTYEEQSSEKVIHFLPIN